jgi:hypothetical protein
MPYYKIEGYKVFLSHDRWLKINSLAMAHKDPPFRVSSMIAGQPAAREADKLRFQQLTKLCREDSDKFFREWVEFDLRGREAQENAWDLLYDYCVLSRVGYLTDARSAVHAILADYADDSYTYPMGRVFALRVLAGHTVASLLHLRPRPTLTLEIDTSQIVSAVGTLDDFRIQFRHCAFQCSRLLSIVLTDAKPETATVA